MTSTRSANATALPSRRSLIATAGMLASMSAAGVTMAMPALADEAGPIERMYPEHVRLATLRAKAVGAAWEAEERYVEPDRPRWHPFTAEGGYKMEIVDYNKKKGRCYLDDSDENIASLKAMIAAPYEGDPECGVSVNTHERRVERAQTTLAHIEAWKAEAQRRADAVGLTQAREADTQARDAAEAHAAAVLAIEPTTFRELAFRAAVLLITWDEDEAQLLADRLTELAGIEPYEPEY